MVAAFLCCVVLPEPGGTVSEGSGVMRRQGDTGPNPPDYAAFVATSDFALTGGFAVIGLDDRAAYLPAPAWAAQVVSPDPVAAAFGDHVFVINRYTYDNISVLNKKFELVTQYSVADPSCDPSNPHDLAFASDTKAYLSRYECRDLWIINPVTGEKLGSINLTSAGYGGSDGIPEMSGLLLHGSTLFVAVQMIDRKTWTSEGKGRVVMIDTATDTIIGDAELVSENPVTDLIYSPDLDLVLVGSAGRYKNIGDGGIEAIDPVSGAALGYVIDETALAGNVADFEIASPTRGYATITTADFQSKLVAFNPQTGTREPGVIYSAAEGFTLWDIALNDRGQLYVCDRNATDPGVIVIDTLDNDRILPPQPVNVGFPPFSIVFLK